MDFDSKFWESLVSRESRRGFFKSFTLSLFIHALLITTLLIYPPTKAIFLQKAHKMTKELGLNLPEKMLEEITIVQIPKKNPSDQIGEFLTDEIGHIELEDDFIPHLDLASELSHSDELNLQIDLSKTFVFSDLEKIEKPLESYLSPLSNPIPEELLKEELLPMASWEPKESTSVEQPPTPQIAKLDEFSFPSYAKALPEMLQTDLFAYTDKQKDRYFKMELKLQDHKLLEEEPGEFLFVIDCTQKNIKANVKLYKEAILKSIKSLKPHDKFNVIYLHKELTPVFTQSESYSVQNHLLVEDLLQPTPKIDGRMKDLVKNLGKLFDKTEENLLHTHVILFTEEPVKETTGFLNLAKHAHSHLSLYPILCSDEMPKKSLLRELTQQMGGRVLASPTRAAFARKFAGLLLDIKKIRLRNVSIQVEGDEGPLDIILSEKTKELTLKKPLKIFGKLEDNKNIKLRVSGTHGEDLYEMDKIIPLSAAKKGSSLIKEELENSNP